MKNFKEFIVSEDYPTSGDYMQPMQADWNVGDIDYIKPNTSKPLRVKKPPKAPNDPGTIPNKAFLDTSKTGVTEAAKCKDCGQDPCICDDSHGFVKEGADDHYAEAEEHLNKASKALETSDMEAHHFHMSNHHEAKSQWHAAKGRYHAADNHAAKAEEHHEKSLKAAGIKEENINELSSNTLQSYKEKAKKSADELTAKGEHGKALDRTMSRMKATGKQITKTTAGIKKAVNEEEVSEGKKSPGIGWMLKKDPTIKAIIDKHKQKMKDFKAHVGSKIEPKDKK